MSKDTNIPISEELNIVSSVVNIKCSGVELQNQIENDLNLPEGKTIAELLYDQKQQ